MPKTSKKTALVTGASGFIGANLVRRLVKENFDVTALTRPVANLWRLGDLKAAIQLANVDLLNFASLQSALQNFKPDYIFHLAAYGSYPFQEDQQKIFETNILGTVNLLRAAEKVGFKKFIATGSSSEYGQKDRAMKETDLLAPNTPYGVSKAASTLYCQHRAREGGLPITILRPFSIYGPWEEKARLVPTLIRRASQGQDLELVSGTVARDWIFVEDAADAYIQATKNHDCDGQILNLCSGRQTTIQEVAEVVLKETAARVKIKQGQYPGRSFDTSMWVGDPQKTKMVLGWVAKTSLSQGIRKTITWYREHGDLYER